MTSTNAARAARPRPARMRARGYAIGALTVPVVAWVLGALTAADGDSDGAVLSGFLAALWSFATYVVLVNVVELAMLLRTVETKRALRRTAAR
jgi:hypothetical protein